jgi:hypothetical protein
MQCPLCAGPLHLENPDLFACERGHQLQGAELARAAAERTTIAFWMAIEALETEAEALRILAAADGGDTELAGQAAEDAKLLRDLASAHLKPLG